MKKIILFVFLLFSLCSFGQSKIQYVRNASYGYYYILPTEIEKEILEENKEYEKIIYNSKKGNYQINIFSEKSFKSKEKARELNNYFEQAKMANHIELKNAVISSYKIDLEKNIIIIQGIKENRKFIWKTIINEIPVSGEFGFNTMIFYYINTMKNKKIGLKLIRGFE